MFIYDGILLYNRFNKGMSHSQKPNIVHIFIYVIIFYCI